MKLERTKNTVNSMIWGFVYKIVNLVLPFIGRTIFIYILGEQYLGLNSLFGSILNVLNITELGFGSAIIYSMYSAIAKDDTNEICALMNFYKKCYRIIGTIVFIIGICLMPFIPHLIKGDVPADINLYVIYGINLFSTGISYFLCAYKHSILLAFQRGDLDNIILIPVDITKYIIQIGLLLIFKNYYLYIIIVPIFNMISNILRGWIADKYYPQYRAKGAINKTDSRKIFRNVKALFISKVGEMLPSSLESVVISMFIGLIILGKYNNYTYIMSSVVGFVALFLDSLKAGWGNSLNTETSERNLEIFGEISFLNNLILCFCSACFMCLYQPFISLWVGESYLLSIEIVALIVINFWISRYPFVMYTCKDAAGIWEKDKYRAFVVGMVQLGLNFGLASQFGLSGIILSAILSLLLVGYPWLIHNVFSQIFKISPVKYIKDTIVEMLMAAGIVAITYYITNLITIGGWLGLICKAILCSILSVILYILVHIRDKNLRYAKQRVERYLERFNIIFH